MPTRHAASVMPTIRYSLALLLIKSNNVFRNTVEVFSYHVTIGRNTACNDNSCSLEEAYIKTSPFAGTVKWNAFGPPSSNMLVIIYLRCSEATYR